MTREKEASGPFSDEFFVLVQNDFDDLHSEYYTDPQCIGLRHVWQEREGVSLHAACHPKARLKFSYEEGVLYVTCQKCDEYVAMIAVARTHKGGLTAEARLYRRRLLEIRKEHERFMEA